MEEEALLARKPSLQPTKGGFRTIPFILASQALEKLAFYGLLPNMIFYLTAEYGMGTAEAANVLFLWSAATNFSPLLGAFLADSYSGRFLVIGIFVQMICTATMTRNDDLCIYRLQEWVQLLQLVVGMLLLWTTTIFPQARRQCDTSPHTCQIPTLPQLFLLYSSFALMSVGAGGARSACLAFSADQLKPTSGQTSGVATSALERLFNWYYISIMVAAFISQTCLVYIQTTFGWEVGFGVPVVLMVLSVVLFFVASPFYIKVEGDSGMLTGLAQVVVAAFRNRRIPLSSDDRIFYCHEKGSSLTIPSEKLRFLNRACATSNPQQDLTVAGTPRNPWKLCTVQQVEDLKSLIKVLPIWSTGIILCVTFAQASFIVLQAKAMDRRTVIPAFEIPPGSFGVFMIISFAVFLSLYDNLIIPLVSKVRRKPVQLGLMQRMGAGLAISVFAIASLAVTEYFRRKAAKDEKSTRLSAMWLLPYMILGGVAEAMNAIAQNEFYYTELPKTMSSIATTLGGLGMAAASLVSSWIIGAVDGATGRWWGGDGASWVSGDIDEGRLDYYYWLITGLSVANFLYFVWCSRNYGKCKVEEREEEDGRCM